MRRGRRREKKRNKKRKKRKRTKKKKKKKKKKLARGISESFESSTPVQFHSNEGSALINDLFVLFFEENPSTMIGCCCRRRYCRYCFCFCYVERSRFSLVDPSSDFGDREVMNVRNLEGIIF
ncbi:hypothetical protein V1478_001441 [Vespula squamosa]|uniref:Uncharacterized protein n=1 Tax=Vespula squamosa TaxID=30214 RepID=A0ABD2C1H5_VESSQ